MVIELEEKCKELETLKKELDQLYSLSQQLHERKTQQQTDMEQLELNVQNSKQGWNKYTYLCKTLNKVETSTKIYLAIKIGKYCLLLLNDLWEKAKLSAFMCLMNIEL